jgi:hypothetical protein
MACQTNGWAPIRAVAAMKRGPRSSTGGPIGETHPTSSSAPRAPLDGFCCARPDRRGTLDTSGLPVGNDHLLEEQIRAECPPMPTGVRSRRHQISRRRHREAELRAEELDCGRSVAVRGEAPVAP